MRQLAAALVLSALAIAAMMGAIGPAAAADLPGTVVGEPPYGGCEPREDAVLYTRHGLVPKYYYPTIPARTPYYTCLTGTVLKPGEIPPPPEYCCS